MRLQSQRRADPEVNLTPLIDVVFLLLIFFMVSTTFERETEVNVELPEADAAAMEAEPDAVEITVDAQGRYYVNRKEVVNTRRETLEGALRQVVEEGEQPQVILSADKQTPHQAVITAMDAARRLGLIRLTFATTRPQGEK